MAFSYSEKSEILLNSSFLIKLGYMKTEDFDSINYTRENIDIVITNSPYYNENEVLIRFKDKNEVFNVGWIALVRDNISIENNRFKEIGTLLKYIEKKYEKLIDYNYCLESNVLIEEYVNKNQQVFIKSINDFLKKNKEGER